MLDSKKKLIIGGISLLLFVTVIALAVLAPKKQENPKPGADIKKKVVDKPKQIRKKKVTTRIAPVAPPLNETLTKEEKKRKFMRKKMTERQKAYYADLFEKYGIDEEGQNAIVKSLTDAHMATRDLMWSSQYHTDKSDEARLEVGEKLALIQEDANNQIIEIAGEEFLSDLEKKKSDSSREHFIKRLDKSLKISDEQKRELDALYSSTQTSFVERFTLPKDELDARKETLQNGIKDILTEEQYSKYQKKGRPSRRGRRKK